MKRFMKFLSYSNAQSFTVHNCDPNGYYPCTGTECGDGNDRYNGVCDKDGCDYAAYRNNQHNFYGPGATVNSNSPVTLITQFITADGTDGGALTEVRRIYQQNGQTIQNAAVNFDGYGGHSSITNGYCSDIKNLFGDPQEFSEKGGMQKMGQALDRGMVLVMSLWDDHFTNMHWLDAVFPDGSDTSQPGNLRGPCDPNGGDPAVLESSVPGSSVTFSDIKIGRIQNY